MKREFLLAGAIFIAIVVIAVAATAGETRTKRPPKKLKELVKPQPQPASVPSKDIVIPVKPSLA